MLIRAAEGAGSMYVEEGLDAGAVLGGLGTLVEDSEGGEGEVPLCRKDKRIG